MIGTIIISTLRMGLIELQKVKKLAPDHPSKYSAELGFKPGHIVLQSARLTIAGVLPQRM